MIFRERGYLVPQTIGQLRDERVDATLAVSAKLLRPVAFRMVMPYQDLRPRSLL